MSEGDEHAEEADEGLGRAKGGRYSRADWRADGYRGPPPWRRGYRPLYLVISLALVALLLAVFLVAGSRLP